MILDVTFELGTNLDMAQVLVQNRVAVAEAKLPEEVKRIGVTTKKKSPSILLCVNLISEEARRQLLLRPALPEQLRHAQRQGRPGPHQGRRRRDVPRPARLQHARLARPGQARRASSDGRRRDQRDPGAERPGRRRPARASRRCRRSRRSAFSSRSTRRAGSTARSSSRTSSSRPATTGQIVYLTRRRPRRPVRRRRQRRREGRRAGRQELRRQQLPRRRAVGHAGRLPACPAPTRWRPPRPSRRRWRS